MASPVRAFERPWEKEAGKGGQGADSQPKPEAARFDKPTYKEYRLDICRVWAGDCGKGAADAFCRTKGYAAAESWEFDNDIGHISPTIVISSEQICSQSYCDGFKFIKCAGRRQK